jgi:MFS transporter, AAHS family, 3-hydroxyphenylpropionic acid transporter
MTQYAASTSTPVRVAGTGAIVGCLLAALCEGFDLQAAGVAATGISAEFAPSPSQLGSFFSASTLGLFCGALIGGRLADAFGRKWTLVASMTVFGLWSICTAFVSSIDGAILVRLLTGLGLGGAFPTLLALVNECSRPHRRRANVTLAYATMPFGGAVVSLVSMLIPSSSWRILFVAGGVAPLLLAPLVYWAIGDSGKASPIPVATPVPAPLPSPARISLSATIRTLFSEGRAVPTALLWCSSFFALLTVYLLLNWLPLLLVEMGFTKPQAAGVQIGFNLGGALSGLFLGVLLEGGYRNQSVVTTFVSIPLLVLVLSHATQNITIVTAVVFVLGCAVLAAPAYLYAVAANTYPTPVRGVGVGTTVAASRLGSIVGPKLGGFFKASGHGSVQLLLDLLPLVVIGSILALALAWRERFKT